MSETTYFMALDAGTTSVKTALFDATGRQVACSVCEYDLEKPSPDIVEVDPELYWRAACDGVRKVLLDSAVPPKDIAAIGVTSQGETLIVLGSDGTPLRKAIVWLDNRAQDEAREIEARFGRREVYRVTGQQEVVPAWTAAKILWLRKHEPEVFKRTKKFLLVGDYLAYRLSGEFATDRALNPSTLYYDLVEDRWWTQMLDFIGVEPSQLPELCDSGASIGKVNACIGLDKSAAVVVAPIDQVAAMVGAGNIETGMVTETTGSAMAVCATTDAPVYDPEMRLGLYRHAVAGRYALMAWVPTAGMALRWFRDNFCANESYDMLSELASQVPPGCDGLTLLPHFCGAFCPEANPAARGVFHGLSLSHGKAHFVRAIMESVAFMLKDNVSSFERTGLSVPAIHSLGGGAESPLWLQIKADVLGKPVATLSCGEATCLGAAMLASVATGLHSSLAEASKAMVSRRREFMPNGRDSAIHEDAYRRYLKLNKAIMPTFGDMK